MAENEGEQEPAGEAPIDEDGQQAQIEKLRSALADLEDAKHRIRRDNDKQMDLLRARVLEQLLPVLDNLERTIAAAEPRAHDPTVRGLVDGVKMVHEQFLSTLQGFGLVRRSAIGERFDPRIHDAAAVVPVADPLQDGIVIAETEPAYVLGERVVRPARVTVGRAHHRQTS